MCQDICISWHQLVRFLLVGRGTTALIFAPGTSTDHKAPEYLQASTGYDWLVRTLFLLCLPFFTQLTLISIVLLAQSTNNSSSTRLVTAVKKSTKLVTFRQLAQTTLLSRAFSTLASWQRYILILVGDGDGLPPSSTIISTKPKMSRPDESRPSRGRKHFTSIQKQSHDPNHIALGRDRSFGLPQRPQFPQGPNKPNTDHPNNPTSSHSARTQPGSGPQPPSQPLQNALHRGDKSSFITLKTDRAPYRSDTKVTENTRLQLETDRWPPQEHEKFCELMMKEWSQATVISDPYRRKAEEVFPDVAKLMAQFGYQRDKEDCYLYWYHVARHESSFKYTLNYPTPPVRENRSLQRMVEDKPVQQLNNSKPKAPISNNTTSTNQRLSNPAKPLERARADARKSTPKPSEKTRADARKAVEEIHKTPYKSDATPGGGSVLIMIPNELVPLIVGRGGETLTNMEKSVSKKALSMSRTPIPRNKCFRIQQWVLEFVDLRHLLAITFWTIVREHQGR